MFNWYKKLVSGNANMIRYIGYAIIYIVLYKMSKTYKMYRDFNKDINIDIKDVSKFKAHFNKKDKKRLENIEFGNEIISYRDELVKNIDNGNLDNLNYNLKTVKLKQSLIFPQNLILIPLAGRYLPKTNTINVLYMYKSEILSHEFLHLASAHYYKNKKFATCGFAQVNTRFFNKNCIGCGINEGYTMVLDNRIFKKGMRTSKGYRACYEIMKYLEIIVGKENLEKYYFNGDLKSLVEDLKQYDSEDHVLIFIKATDFILKYYDNAYGRIISKLPGAKRKVNCRLDEVKHYLKKWYLMKLKRSLLHLDSYEDFSENVDSNELLKRKSFLEDIKLTKKLYYNEEE